MANYVFPSDLTSRQQGHFMKIIIEPSKVGSAPTDINTIMLDRKSTRLNSSHMSESRMPSSA